MGFRISWLAAHGLSKDDLLAATGLADTGEPDEANEASFSVASLPTGWTVLWANDVGFASDSFAERLATTGRAILAVRVNETCMHSTATLFEAGAQRWRWHHEGDERIDFLESEGVLPPEAAEIEAGLRRAQQVEGGEEAEVDHLFDAPLELARQICGYKHDLAGFDWGEPSFTVARQVADLAPSPWWNRWRRRTR